MADRNFTNASSVTGSLWVIDHGWLKLWIALILVFCLIGAFLNILLFSAIVSSQKLRSGSGTLIAHSVLLQTILCAVVLPLLAASYWTSLYHAPSENMCRTVMALFYTFMWAFNWATVPVAANRLVAICFPQYYRACVAKLPLLCAMLIAWAVALCCMSGVITSSVTTSAPIKAFGGCGSAVKRHAIYGGLSALATTVPAVIEGLLYASLFTIPYLRAKFVAHRRIGGSPASPPSTTNQQRLQLNRARRLRVTQTVFAAYVWSAVCLLSGPISISAARGHLRVMAVVPLLAPALVLLGHSTSPVRLLREG